jgi:16S rRNA (cytidine1402-2'-O)-methyltransferase
MLYIVSTPIGNLGDITYRAVEVLKSVDLVACEDTRHTKILLRRYDIRTPTTSYYEYNKIVKGDYLLKLLKEGKRIALVSDAGTPGISDPGFNLIKSAMDEGIQVISVPGPTALISALSISGFATHRFVFEGFLPIKSGARKRRLEALKSLDVTTVLYESPHRILKTLEDMQEILGPLRQVAIVREVTKKFEEVLKGDIETLLKRLKSSKPRGEFVIIF